MKCKAAASLQENNFSFNRLNSTTVIRQWLMDCRVDAGRNSFMRNIFCYRKLLGGYSLLISTFASTRCPLGSVCKVRSPLKLRAMPSNRWIFSCWYCTWRSGKVCVSTFWYKNTELSIAAERAVFALNVGSLSALRNAYRVEPCFRGRVRVSLNVIYSNNCEIFFLKLIWKQLSQLNSTSHQTAVICSSDHSRLPHIYLTFHLCISLHSCLLLTGWFERPDILSI